MEEQPYAPSFVVADSLDELRGPTCGEVTLPNRLLWNPSRPFDLADDDRHRSLIRIVLREARSQDDLAEFVDRAGLVRLWPSLGLPEAIAAAWEARFPELRRSPMAEPRRQQWADEHPEALQVLADPTIKVADGLDERLGWQVPAGWVGIVNQLHRDLVDMLGEYEVIRAGNKMSALRYAIDHYRRNDDGPDVWQAVNDRIVGAAAESLSTCDLCGEHAEGTVSFGVTRCQGHGLTRSPAGRLEGPPGATARPPGWSPRA